jgi:AraC-like DNA-binding protein
MPGKHAWNLSPEESIPMLQDYYFPPYITLAHMFNAPVGWKLGPRVMQQFQLQYVVDGVAEAWIDGKHYPKRKGDLFLHWPDEPHSVHTIGNEKYVCISIVFHFGGSAFPFEQLCRHHHMGNFQGLPLETKLSQLVIHYHQTGLVAQLQCQQLLMGVLVELASGSGLSRSPEDGTGRSSRNIAKLVLIKNYIDEHYNESISLSELEQLTGYGANHIISMFKKRFGTTPIQYQTNKRIQKAKELIIHSGMSVSEIADAVGYSNVHAFSKIFKRKTGTSLTEYAAALWLPYSY